MPSSSAPLARPIFCMVTDVPAHAHGPLLSSVAAAAHAGVNLIQIRDHEATARALTELTRAALKAVAGTAARVVVNDRLDVALAAGASGVHLRSESMPASRVRAVTPPGFLVGQSVHSVAEADAADAAGACDYLIFGTIFASTSKPAGHRSAGLEPLRSICARVRTPVLAIGGVSLANASEIAQAGSAGIAAISLFRQGSADQISQAVGALRRAFDR
jgi:thiamine-phosphate pyrophosphorylase